MMLCGRVRTRCGIYRAHPASVGSFGRAFLTDLDLRLIIPTLALIVAFLAYHLAGSKDRREREREREKEQRLQEAERQQQEAAAQERACFLAGFGELRFEPDPDGERRLVWKHPPGWDVPEDLPQEVSPEDVFWLRTAVYALPADLRPGIMDSNVEAVRGPRIDGMHVRYLYATNRERTLKQRVISVLDGRRFFQTVEPRRGEPEPDKCIRDRRYIAGGGNFCNVCGRSVEKLREVCEDELREYRAKRKAP
jgi:hypothetical protein